MAPLSRVEIEDAENTAKGAASGSSHGGTLTTTDQASRSS